MNWLKHF
jgi:hypothetical protein